MTLLRASMPNYDVPRPSPDAILRLECWYHGTLTRVRAESLVRNQGDFLVRDSISSKGDFVLTVFSGGRAIHFQINRDASVDKSGDYLYQFEEEQFESVSDLIIFYQTHRKPITRSSSCVISNPVSKTTIVQNNGAERGREIEQNYMKIMRPQQNKCGTERSLSQQVLLNEARKVEQLHLNGLQGPSHQKPESQQQKSGIPLALSSLLNRPLPQPVWSPPAVDDSDQEEYCEMDYDAMDDATSSAVLRTLEAGRSGGLLDGTNLNRNGTEVLDACTYKAANRCAMRTSCASLIAATAIAQKCGPDVNKMSRSCQDVSRLNWRLPRAGSIPALPKRCEPLVPIPSRDSGFVPDDDRTDYDQPRAPIPYENASTSASIIDARNYRSPLFEDPTVTPRCATLITKLRLLLVDNSPAKCGEMITVEDCRLFRISRTAKMFQKFRQLNGLSLLLSPHEVNIRNDLNERTHSLYFLCIISILEQSEHKDFMHKTWIEIAQSLIYKFGNAFSFLTIMSALSSEAVKSIHGRGQSWSGMSDYQSLLPFADLIQRCKPLPPGAPTILLPFVQPLLNLMSSSPSYTFLESDATISTQIESLWKWLEAGRRWSRNANQIAKDIAEKCLSPSPSHCDNFLSVEFSLRFLFSLTDLNVQLSKRYSKLAASFGPLNEHRVLQT